MRDVALAHPALVLIGLGIAMMVIAWIFLRVSR